MKLNFLQNINIKRILVAVIILVAISFLFLNEKGILKYLKLNNEISEIDNKIQKVENQKKQIEKEIDSLQFNDEKIEDVARKKYGMKRKGEKVIEVSEE